jgi:hypothetical protein
MRHSVTFGHRTEQYLDALLAMGIYGRTKSEIVRRFTESSIQKMFGPDAGAMLARGCNPMFGKETVKQARQNQ